MTDTNQEKNQGERKIVKIPATITVKHFADILELSVTEVIAELMKNQIMATINEEIDFDTAALIADELDFEAEEDLEIADDEIITLEKLLEICDKEKESDKNFPTRPPIITILGHVDHGKTTLLDTIRKSSVATGEAGGITQHITAYQVKKRGQKITFIDTPGHEAFAAMRERGVSIADIAILVVAADDGVRPQTKEVIKYLKEKNIPTIVAINKIDKPNANPNRVKQELAEYDIVIEEWGGKVMCNEISAKNKIGINDLLESILLLTEVEDLKADAKRDGLAIVLESHKDPQKGPVATVVVKTGTLKVGQDVTVGKTYGRIRRLEDFAGQNINSAEPSMPVIVFGLSDTVETNSIIQVADAKRSARLKSEEMALRLAGSKRNVKSISDKDVAHQLNIIVKADVQGSIEAIDQVLGAIPQTKVSINYVNVGVGNITESDIKLAESSQALIFGFNVSVSPVAKRMAENNNVEVEIFTIIYKLVEDVQARLLKLLPEEIERNDLGKLKILGIFRTEKDKMIIGGEIIEGVVVDKDVKMEIFRGENQIGEGELLNLQHNKVDVNEVKKGNQCGITMKTTTKIKIDDQLHFYQAIVKPKSLE
jgi:translation initiation factor IF-2